MPGLPNLDTPPQRPVVSGPVLPPPRMQMIWGRLRLIIWPPSATRGYRIMVLLAAGIILVAIILSLILLSIRKSDNQVTKTEATSQETDKTRTNSPGGPLQHSQANGEKPATNKDKKQDAPKPGASVPTGGGAGTATSGTGGATTPPAASLTVCPPFPAFPDENCTGWKHTGVTLKHCNEGDADEGDGHFEKANAVYDGCEFKNGVVIQAPNITIKRSKIVGTVNSHWSTDYDFQNLTLVDVEIVTVESSDPSYLNADQGGSATNGANFTCIRCHIWHTPTGISLGNNSVIQDSYIHDVNWAPGAHQAGIGAGQGSGNHSKLIHNNIQCNRWNTAAPGFQQGCSSALSLYDEPTLDDVLVQNNLFNTAGGYCTYGGGPQGTNIRYINNYFGKKFSATCGTFGAVSAFYPSNTGNVWTGNRWADGSGLVLP